MPLPHSTKRQPTKNNLPTENNQTFQFESDALNRAPLLFYPKIAPMKNKPFMSLHLALCLSLCTIVLFCLRFKSIQGTRQSVSGRLVFHLRLIPLHKLRHAWRELWYFVFDSYQFKKLGRVFLGDWYFTYGSYLCTNFGTHGVSCGISSSTHTNSRNSAEFLCRFIYNLNRSYFAKVAIVYKNASDFALA